MLKFILALLAGLALAMPPAAAQERRSVRIATEGAYPPFNLVGDNGELQGFEIDLGRALCEAMEADCTFVRQDWDGMVGGLVKGRYDAIMSSMAITRERRLRMGFSKPYYRVPAAFMARKGETVPGVRPEDLAGRTLGAVGLSEHAALLDDRYKQSTVRVFGKLDEAYYDLMLGRVDLVLADRLALSRFLETREGACCRVVADAPYDPVYHGFGVGVGVRRDDHALRTAFDAAIDKVLADGTYDRIRQRYFPFDVRF